MPYNSQELAPPAPAPALLPPSDDPGEFVASHTHSAEEMARIRGLMRTEETTEQEVFAGHPTIGRDTFPVEGHVDIRSWVGGGEAIVVDSKTESEGYDKLRDAYGKRIREGDGSERGTLKAIFESVSETMDYDLDTVNTWSASLGSSKHRKINLSTYLREGVGVCRHMALAASWLGGEAYEQGALPGAITAEVNQRNKEGQSDAHEWARYTSPTGEVYIIDPAQGFFGTLEESMTSAQWEYFRPGEKKAFLAGQLTKHALENSVISFEGPQAPERVTDPAVKERFLQYKNTSRQFLGITRDHEKIANHTPEADKSLRSASERFFTIGKEILLDEAATSGETWFAMQGLGELADKLSEGLDIERTYPKGLIVGDEDIARWLNVVFDAIIAQHGQENASKDYTYVNNAGQQLLTQLDRRIR
jgi:hypothetical protein